MSDTEGGDRPPARSAPPAWVTRVYISYLFGGYLALAFIGQVTRYRFQAVLLALYVVLGVGLALVLRRQCRREGGVDGDVE